jgi:hypothetical protein
VSGSELTDAACRSFVEEKSHHVALAELLGRLRSGHDPDVHGWCSHRYHACQRERHPCPILQFADLVERYNAGSGGKPSPVWAAPS